MSRFRLVLLFLLGPSLVVTACYASSRACYPPEQAAEHTGKEICLSAHVYDVVETSDGSRYLDVCKPETADADCRLVIVSMAADRKDVGGLNNLRDQDVNLRGVVHSIHGQSVMLLSHERQFRDGPEKFRPNPELLSGFSAGSAGTAFREPSLEGHRRKSTAFRSGAIQVH